MALGTTPSGTRTLSALALAGVLALGGCADDGTGDAPDQQPTSTQGGDETPAEQATAEDGTGEDGTGEQTEEQAAPDAGGDCPVDAATVTDAVGIGLEIALEDVNEVANDGVSCIYEAETDEVAVIVSVSAGSWDGTDQRVEQVVSQTEELFGEPVATPPDLDGQAFLFDDDFGGTSLVVFVDGMQYSTGISGAGFSGTPLESLDGRQSVLVQLHQAASG